MPELSDFRLGSDVVAGDGTKVGSLVSVLVEKDAFEPRAVVVKQETSFTGRLLAEEKFFITDEVVIPMASVASATGELVQLSITAAEVREQPAYLSYRFKPMTLGTAALEEGEMLGGMGTPNVEQVANKGVDEIEIEHGANVMLGETGRRLGQVHDVLYDKGHLIGVVIRPDGFFKHDVVLPIRFISRADDLALFAQLSESDIEQLQPFTEGHGQ